MGLGAHGQQRGYVGFVRLRPRVRRRDRQSILPKETTGAVKGVSVDKDGFIWAVTKVAHKIDPETLDIVGTYDGLDEPYTYSDITGWALQNASCAPEG